MKTQIITLESHDDLISVRDRMSWAKTPRILLVWPKYEKVTLRQVDLKVLQRHAASLGAQLGLVTRTRRVREDAEALKIPVFESTGQAQRVAWPKPRRTRKRLTGHAPRKDLREQREQLSADAERDAWSAHPILRVAAFVLGVASVLVLVALFIPRAEVVLHPKSKIQSIVLPVMASASVDSVFITGNIPARERRVIVDGSQTVVVTGEGVMPQSKAKGAVIFRNLTQQSVPVPAGTVVKTVDNIRFVTTSTSEMDAGVGKMLELPIEAMEGGLSGNVDAETIVIVEGRLGLSLSVTNPESTSGGREIPSVQASDTDRERAKDQLMETLKTEARAQLTDQMKPDDIIFEDTFAVSQILSEVSDPPAGAAGTKLTLTMQVEFSTLYASAQDLTELASLALNASLPAGFRAAAGSEALTVKSVTKPTVNEDGSTHWTVRAERRIVQQINNSQVTQLIQGIRSQRVKTLLEKSLPLEGSPQISLAPSWWPWVPIVPFRISVVTE
jgi:Baseplate J-like protein